jgi:polysaccharide deacetylase 2 family uncharacterized protein YibQ
MTKFRLLIGLGILIVGGTIISFLAESPVEDDHGGSARSSHPELVDPDPIGTYIASLPDVIDETASQAQWQKYAVAVDLARDQSAIAIVIDDLGNSEERLDHVLSIDAPLSLSFLSYAAGLPEMVDRARLKGHEILVHLPMEPLDGDVDAGIKALTTGMSSDELVQAIDWHLSRMHGYVGFNNHMGSKLTADTDRMNLVIKAAKDRGLIFLDSRTTDRTVAGDMARAAGVPTLDRDIFLDNQVNETAILAQLARAEEIARIQGSAVVIAHPYALTVDLLQKWLPGLDDIQIVPLSALVIRNEGIAAVAQD